MCIYKFLKTKNNNSFVEVDLLLLAVNFTIISFSNKLFC